jgi:hypothetical protein
MDARYQIEIPFSFSIDDNMITGRIDQIISHDDEIELIDFKSGVKNPQLASPDIEIQLRLYRMAVELCSDFENLQQKRFLLKYLFLGEERNQELILPEDFYDYGEFRLLIKKMIGGIKKEDFAAAAKNSFNCRNCGIRLLCKNGQNPEQYE